MTLINPDLPQISNEVKNQNSTSSYLPVNTNGKNDFDWDRVASGVLQVVQKKKIKGLSIEQLTEESKLKFSQLNSSLKLWSIVEKMYFQNEQIYKICPEFLLFKAQDTSLSGLEKRIVRMFASMLQANTVNQSDSKVNFLENPILDVLLRHMVEDKGLYSQEAVYLPFLEGVISQDIKFLLERPKYLLSNFRNTLEFYGFIFLAQLALSISDWKSQSAPEAKPLFFILEHEKASTERVHLKNQGFKSVKESLPKVFPYLSMLELVQTKPTDNSVYKRQPLWSLMQCLTSSNSSDDLQRLRGFSEAFKEQRELDHVLTLEINFESVLTDVFELANEQFSKTAKGARHGANAKVVSGIQEMFFAGFVQSRGRYGNALVLKQDMLILLTNLTIGNQEKLRFHEVIKGFERRGVFTDKQTQQELINFYERIGNVERMSDSGDAVYVRKTV
jgi:DNA phosphorothioation-dependent restriction protein DptG